MVAARCSPRSASRWSRATARSSAPPPTRCAGISRRCGPTSDIRRKARAMTLDRPASTLADVDIVPTNLSPSVRQRILLYLGILIILVAFGSPSGGLIDIPVSFLLKNKLHLSAHEVAGFRLVAAIPLYLAFAFGFIRDTWNPFGMRDRGFMLLFGAISALLYVFFAFTSASYVTLIVAVVILTISCLFVASAQNGL